MELKDLDKIKQLDKEFFNTTFIWKRDKEEGRKREFNVSGLFYDAEYNNWDVVAFWYNNCLDEGTFHMDIDNFLEEFEVKKNEVSL